MHDMYILVMLSLFVKNFTQYIIYCYTLFYSFPPGVPCACAAFSIEQWQWYFFSSFDAALTTFKGAI